MTDREYTKADSEADEAAANVMPYSDAFDIWLASEPAGSILLSPEQRMRRAWQAAPPADDEAVRLLRKARKMWVDDDSITAEEIDAYLEKVGK